MTVAADEESSTTKTPPPLSVTNSNNDNHNNNHSIHRSTDDWEDALEEQAGESVPSNDFEEAEQFGSNHDASSLSRQAIASKLREQEEKEEAGDDARQNRRRHCQCCRRWPRLCVVFVGVILPLWLLIIISTGVGSWLAVLELPDESK